MHSASVWLSSLTLAAAGGWLAATTFAAPATSKEPRFPQLTMDQINDQQKPLGEAIMKVSSVGIGGHCEGENTDNETYGAHRLAIHSSLDRLILPHSSSESITHR